MVKVAIVVLANRQSHGDFARVANALEAVKEFKEAKDDIRLIFDGAGSSGLSISQGPTIN